MKKIKIFISHDNPDFENRIRYVFKFLETHPLVEGKWSYYFEKNPHCNIQLHYESGKGFDSENQDEQYFFIPAQKLVFSAKTVDPSQLNCNPYQQNGQELYSVENQSKPKQTFLKENHFQFDIIETIFFHISRYEEVFAANENLNQAGWLDEKKQLLIRHHLEQMPVVDHLVKVFFEVLSKTRIHQKTTYDISHDVDILYRLTPFSNFIRSIVANLLYRRGFEDLKNTFWYWIAMQTKKVKDPYDNFEKLLRKENIWKSKQLFLMVDGNTKFDNKYSIDHPYIDKIVKIARERGYKIGLHPSYNAGFERKMYSDELNQLSKKLNENIQLNRQHWLRFSWEITPYLWEDHSIKMDFSMGYNHHLGFRCGTGFAYYMYDFKKEKAFGWKEQPMAFMESAAIHFATNENLDLKETMKDFFSENKTDTHININFHNSNFDPLTAIGETIADFYYNELIKLIEG